MWLVEAALFLRKETKVSVGQAIAFVGYMLTSRLSSRVFFTLLSPDIVGALKRARVRSGSGLHYD
jgi:hypothetical protein